MKTCGFISDCKGRQRVRSLDCIEGSGKGCVLLARACQPNWLIANPSENFGQRLLRAQEEWVVFAMEPRGPHPYPGWPQ